MRAEGLVDGGGDQGGQRSLLVNDNTDRTGLVLGNKNIAALEIRRRYPAARLWRNSYQVQARLPKSSHAKPAFLSA